MDDNRKLFVSLVLVLLGFGALIVHSASITSQPSQYERIYLSRHLIFMAIGVVAATIAASLPSQFWSRSAPFLFAGTVLLLILVLIPGVGTRINGAQRWFRYGALSVQPSEIAKITLPLFMCCLIDHRRSVLHTWIRGTFPLVWPMLVIIPLVLRQPDLGTSLFLTTAAAMALFVGGWPIRNFVLGAIPVVPAIVYLVLHKPYQMQRIYGFLTTWADWTNAPYQVKQSLVTLGAGGLWGVGLGKGFQKLSFLPEANTDFVFAVIGEELGLIGVLSLIGLWIWLYLIGLKLLDQVPRQTFAHNAGCVLLTQLIVQVALNVAVVTAMVPPKGIPHPLISYGGSNLVISLVALGVFLSLTRSVEQQAAAPISSDVSAAVVKIENVAVSAG